MHELEEIRRCYGPVVWKTVYRILRDYSDSLDCYQDVFCEILQCLGQHKVENWPALMRWLAVRRALDRLRTRSRTRRRWMPTDPSQLADAGPTPGERAEFHELVELVRSELAKLPHRQAEAFWLRCVEEMSYEEIGRQMGVDTSTVGVLIHRARSRLRLSLADFAAGGLRE